MFHYDSNLKSVAYAQKKTLIPVGTLFQEM